MPKIIRLQSWRQGNFGARAKDYEGPGPNTYD